MRPQKRLDRRLEEGAKAVGGGYCRLQMPLRLALAVRETVPGVGWAPWRGGGGPPPPPFNASLAVAPSVVSHPVARACAPAALPPDDCHSTRLHCLHPLSCALASPASHALHNPRDREPCAAKAHALSCATGRDALEGKGPQRRPQKRLGRRLEGVAKAVGGGYCRLQMPLSLALGVRGTVAGHRLGAPEGGGGVPPPVPMHPWPQVTVRGWAPARSLAAYGNFSALCYHVGRLLAAQRGVPVGLIQAAYPAVTIHHFLPASVRVNPNCAHVPWRPPRTKVPAYIGSYLWNHFFAPLCGLAVAAVVWYQGESDAASPRGYNCLLQRLVEAWRARVFRPADARVFVVSTHPFPAMEQVCGGAAAAGGVARVGEGRQA